ncbi:ABC transporter substrate-binding protein [Streptomyces sp. GESEQ-35]|uniref:ABC transporter substrate-binding protein n=1 Tax=Streptomyces sp. GESEQ-35 TaxID=2812657 RepID=UPI001B32957F|nr:ABC transporter substrate-binding protein [Streptomyces sp. GESEQ-35]
MRHLLPIAAASTASLALVTACGAGSTANSTAPAATATVSSACKQLQATHPDLKGKTLTNAINPHTPGYEAIDPKDPTRYIGFDIDLGEALGHCLGFELTYKAVAFPALLPTLQSGQADLVISDIYATQERAKAADFITYSKVFDGVLVRKGNPKKITGIDTSLCGSTAALNTGFVEVPLVQNLADDCKAAGRPAPTVQLYDNNAQCVQAILAGRADTYINDVNTVNQAVEAHPDDLGKATAVTLPYDIGIAVPKDKAEFRDALKAALVEIQKDGTQTRLLKKWSLESGSLKAPRLVTG